MQEVSSEIYDACLHGKVDEMKRLLETYGDKPEYQTCLHEALCTAAYFSHKDVVAMLVAHPTIDVKHVSQMHYQRTALTQACYSSRPEKLDIIKMLLAHPDIDLYQEDKDGATPLSACCAQGSTDTLRLLLEDKRVDYDRVMAMHESPFVVACYRQRLLVVKHLIAYASETSTLEFPEDSTIDDQLRDAGRQDILQVLYEFWSDPKATIAKYRAELQLSA